jgi:hypothetical protein
MKELEQEHEHLLMINKIFRKKIGRTEFCFYDVQEMILEAKEFINYLENSINQEKFLQEEIKTLLDKFKKYGYEL